MVVAVPALQLLSIPAGLWLHPPARAQLAADLQSAAVGSTSQRWTLSPDATERGLWQLLPAIAAFLAALLIAPLQRRRVLQVLVAMVAFNVLFAFFQAGLPPDSPLRLFDFSSGFGGLFPNKNQQGTSLLVGIALAVGLAADAHRRAMRETTRSRAVWLYAGLALLFVLVMPLSNSRAGVALALPTLVLAVVCTGALPLARIRDWRVAVGATGLVAIAGIGLWSALGWLGVDEMDEIRHVMRSTAMQLGHEQAPLGSGIGSFVPVFEQGLPERLLFPQYINHAHNEYAQWWLTGGWLAMAALAGVLAVLAVAAWRAMQVRGRSAGPITGGTLVAIVAVLAHSWVDYPLRTLAFMATTSALMGLLLSSLADSQRDMRAIPRAGHTAAS